MPTVVNKTNASNIWRAIVHNWSIVERNLSWVINDGTNTRFWRDNWTLEIGKLEDQFPSSIPQAELNFPVSFYAANNEWRWDMLNNILPDNVCTAIANVRVPSPGQEDFASWNSASDGQFSIKTAC